MPIEEMSISFSSPPEPAKTEKFAMGQVFLSKKPDGTIRRYIVPITIEGPNAQIAEDCRKRLIEKLQTNGQQVSHINIKRLTVKYSDGTIGKLEKDEDVEALRKIYSDFAYENKISVSWPAYSEKIRGDLNGPRCLLPASTRTLAMRGWDQIKIAERLELDSEQKKRLEKMDQFLSEMKESIQKIIDQDPPISEKRKKILQKLKEQFENCDRFALIAADRKATREQLENALKVEDGDVPEDGLWGLLGYKKADLTDGERTYLDDIVLLGIKDTAELAIESEKLGRDVTQDCFERVLLQAFNADSLVEAIKGFCSHPFIEGLVKGLVREDLDAIGQAFEKALPLKN